MDFSALVAAFEKNLAFGLLAVAVFALGYLFRDGRKRDDDARAREDALHEAYQKRLAEAVAAQIASLERVIPLSTDLVKCLEMINRLQTAAVVRAGGAA